MKRYFVFLLMAAVQLACFAQQTVTYPAVPGMRTSTDFKATVNGQEVWTEVVGAGGMEDLNMVNFSCQGEQKVVITVSEDITSYQILPKSAGIKGEANGHELTFTINGPQKLYIEVNKLPHLALFANPLEKDAPKPNDKKITYYGPGNHEVGQLILQVGTLIMYESLEEVRCLAM